MRITFGEVRCIYLGSIGTLVETSELQLLAFNSAFKEYGLSWNWELKEYQEMLVKAGGQDRLKRYAESCNTNLDEESIKALHVLKTQFFEELLQSKVLFPREGVAELMTTCSKNRIMLCWITSTSQRNINAISNSLQGKLDFNLFDLITSENDCIKSKPDPEIYLNSIEKTQVPRHLSVAIEDSESGFYSAEKAGLKCLVVPGEYKKSQNYASSACVLTSLKNFHIDQNDLGFCGASATT
ncbi:MAG: HAD-IA family hydrolase [Pseudomonadota bacterium]|nr:HAD-IA family hydrolase [Pseudomonadota bacterium]